MPRIGILLNPRAGRGLAPAYAEAIGAALRNRGFEPVVRETEKDAIRLPDEIEGPLWLVATALFVVRQPPSGKWVFLFFMPRWVRKICLPHVALENLSDIAELAVRGELEELMRGERLMDRSPSWRLGWL